MNPSTYGVAISAVDVQPECRAIYVGTTGTYYLLRAVPGGDAWIEYKNLQAGLEYAFACKAVSTTANGLTSVSSGDIIFEY